MKIVLADSLFKPANKDYLGFLGTNPNIQITPLHDADFIWYCCCGDREEIRQDLRILNKMAKPLISVTLGDWGYEECLSLANIKRHFSSSGVSDNRRLVPYLYTCERIPGHPKSLLASFLGTFNSHAHRRRLIDFRSEDVVVEERRWWDVSDSERAEMKAEYLEVLRRSMFCFCPSGYGHSTMRLSEAILNGSIPIMIEDSSRLFGCDLSDFAILTSFDGIAAALDTARKMGYEEYEARVHSMTRFRDDFLLRDLAHGCHATIGYTEWIREMVLK
jgi:hypothetical protein